MSKKRTESHIVGTKGVSLLRNLLSPSEIVFDEINQQNDYGIDATMQIFKLKGNYSESTGEVYFAQVKGKKSVDLKKNKLGFSYSLKSVDAENLLENLKVPIVLFVCVIESNNAYWVDIQTNKKIEEEYQIMKQKKNSSMSIFVDFNNSIPATTNKMLEYLNISFQAIAKKTIIKQNSLHILDDLSKETLNIVGLEKAVYHGDHKSAPKELFDEAFMLKSFGSTSCFYYLSNKNEPFDFQLDLSFEKSNLKSPKLEELRKVLRKKMGKIELTQKDVKAIKVYTKDIVLFDTHNASSFKFTIEKSIRKYKNTMYIREPRSGDEIKVETLSWIDDKFINIETDNTTKQIVELSTTCNLLTNENSWSFKVLNGNIPDFETDYYVSKFFKNLDVFEIYVYINGIKRTLLTGKLNAKERTSVDYLDCLIALYEIQKILQIDIPYPLPDEFTAKDVSDIHKAKKTILEKNFIQTISGNVFIEQKDHDNLVVGDEITIVQPILSYTILNKEYSLNGFVNIIKGKISKISKNTDSTSLNIEITEAVHSIEKKSEDEISKLKSL